MATPKITFQDILNKSNPVFDPDLKAEIERRVRKVNEPARATTRVMNLRSKTLQSIYFLLTKLKYDEVERVKTLPAKIVACSTRASIATLVKEFNVYQDVLFKAATDYSYVYLTHEAELVLREFDLHLFKDLL